MKQTDGIIGFLFLIILVVVYVSSSITLFFLLPFFSALGIMMGLVVSTIGIFLYMLENYYYKINKEK